MRRIHTTFSKSLTSWPLNFFSLECKTKVCLWLEKQQFDHINVNEKRASSQCLLVLNPCFQSTTRERERAQNRQKNLFRWWNWIFGMAKFIFALLDSQTVYIYFPLHLVHSVVTFYWGDWMPTPSKQFP